MSHMGRPSLGRQLQGLETGTFVEMVPPELLPFGSIISGWGSRAVMQGGHWCHIATRFWSHFQAQGSSMCSYRVALVPVIPRRTSLEAEWDELQHLMTHIRNYSTLELDLCQPDLWIFYFSCKISQIEGVSSLVCLQRSAWGREGLCQTVYLKLNTWTTRLTRRVKPAADAFRAPRLTRRPSVAGPITETRVSARTRSA